MKKIIFALTLSLLGAQAHANQFFTQDRVDYIILLKKYVTKDAEQFAECLEQVQAISDASGYGEVQVASRAVGILAARLSHFGAREVAELECVQKIREENEVYPLPRVGRSN